MSQLDYSKISDDAISLLQQLIQNKCVNNEKVDSGNEMRSVNTLINYFKKFNITDYEVFETAPGRGNLLIRIKGTSDHKSLMYQSHLDVVPVTNNWSVDPFAAIIKDNWIYGRGAMDMLYFTATQAAAFAHLYASGWRPTGDFVFLAVADEEAGSEYGAKWLIENVPDKIKADYMFSEFGGAVMKTAKGNLKSTIMIAEKGLGWTKLLIRGEPGHGSSPYNAINALEIASEIITNMQKIKPEIVITSGYREFINGLELGLKGKLVTNKFLLDKILASIAKKDPGQASVLYSLTRMTISPTVLNAGNKANIIPDRAELILDIRLLPGQDSSTIKNYFDKVIPAKYKDRVEVIPIKVEPSSQEDWDDPIIEIIRKTTKEIIPDLDVSPLFLPAVTDARYFRKIGIKCLGYSILGTEVETELLSKLAHGNDERIPVNAVKQTAEFFTKFAIEFFATKTD